MNEKEHERITTAAATKAFHCSRIMGISQFKFKRTNTHATGTTNVLLGEICRRIVHTDRPENICSCFMFYPSPFLFHSLSRPHSHFTLFERIVILRLCRAVCLCESVRVCVCVVCKSLCVRALTERWLTNIGSVMFVKRAFVFEGVSKTTHSVRYSDTTDAIFSLVYICFHILVFGLYVSILFFCSECAPCVYLCGRVSRALPLHSFFLFCSRRLRHVIPCSLGARKIETDGEEIERAVSLCVSDSRRSP